MKKIWKFMLVLILSLAMIGCSSKDDESAAVKKQVDSFFTVLKKGDTDKVQKLCSTSVREELQLSDLDELFEEFTDTETYGETFIKEANKFKEDAFSSLFENIKIGKITVKDDKATVVVTGKVKDFDDIDFDSSEVNTLVQNYINEHISEFAGMTSQKEMTVKVFDDVSKDMFDVLRKQLKDVKSTSFTAKLTLSKIDNKWKITEFDD